MKLFAILVGGEHPGANIELHDMRFVVAPSLSKTYSALRRQWWGSPDGLHVDCWAEVAHADGHVVSLRPEPFAEDEKLYFVNLGGYEAGGSTEVHRNVFVVATTEEKAKSRALRHAKSAPGWIQPHRDDMYEAEHAFCLNKPLGDRRLYVHLHPDPSAANPVFTCAYTPIRKAR